MPRRFGNSFQHSTDSMNIATTPSENPTPIILAKGDSNPYFRSDLRKLRINTQTFRIFQERLEQKMRELGIIWRFLSS
jgi:hypothetical protein